MSSIHQVLKKKKNGNAVFIKADFYLFTSVHSSKAVVVNVMKAHNVNGSRGGRSFPSGLLPLGGGNLMVILMIDDTGCGTRPRRARATEVLSPGTTPPRPLPRGENQRASRNKSRVPHQRALFSLPLLSPSLVLPPSAPFLCPLLSRSEAITGDKHGGLYQQDAPGINEKA